MYLRSFYATWRVQIVPTLSWSLVYWLTRLSKMHGFWHRQTYIHTCAHTGIHTHITTIKGNGDMNLKRTRFHGEKREKGEKGRKKGYNFITISKMKIVSKNVCF